MARAPASQCRKPASMPRRMGSDSSCEMGTQLGMHVDTEQPRLATAFEPLGAEKKWHSILRSCAQLIPPGCPTHEGIQVSLTRSPRRSAVASSGSSSAT